MRHKSLVPLLVIVSLTEGALGQPGDGASFYALSADDPSLYHVTLAPLGSKYIGPIAPLAADAVVVALAHAGPGLAYCIERSENRLLVISLVNGQVVSSVLLDEDVLMNQRGLDTAPDGTLWGVLPGLQLRTIDPTSGQTTLVAPISGVSIIEAIAFSPQGTLYAVGDATSRWFSSELYTLDMITGATTLIAELSVDDVDALTWGADGYLYGADARTSTAELYQIDPTSGALRTMGDTGVVHFNGILGAADACYPDCDGDDELTFFDFLCFQNLFALGSLLADCDGDGELTFFDFLCFQNEFAAGCSG